MVNIGNLQLDIVTEISDSDEDLLGRLRAGEEAAFVALYRRRQSSIYRFACHMTGSPSIAEDVTQEVFLALLKTDCSFDPARGTLSGYLFGIARKLVLRHLDRSRAVVELEDQGGQGTAGGVSATPDPLADLMRREGLENLRRAILTLPKRYREVVALCDLEEVDYLEAAAALDCPVGTVRSRLHRARALLLEKLLQKKDATIIRALKPARSLI